LPFERGDHVADHMSTDHAVPQMTNGGGSYSGH
jgi:hypothetical protein